MGLRTSLEVGLKGLQGKLEDVGRLEVVDGILILTRSRVGGVGIRRGVDARHGSTAAWYG